MLDFQRVTPRGGARRRKLLMFSDLPPPSFFLDKRLVVVIEQPVPHGPLRATDTAYLVAVPIKREDAVFALDGDDGGRVFGATLGEPIHDLVSHLWCFT